MIINEMLVRFWILPLFALKGKVHWEAFIHVDTPITAPTNDCLVGLDFIAGHEHTQAVSVDDAGDKVVNQHPMVLLQGHASWLFGWLTRPPDGIPDVVKVVA